MSAMQEHDHDEALERIEHKLDRLIRKVEQMAIDQATFDNDLAGLVQAVTDLNTAVDAFIAAHPGIDFSTEDANVLGAKQALADELAKITPAPAP